LRSVPVKKEAKSNVDDTIKIIFYGRKERRENAEYNEQKHSMMRKKE